MGACSNRRPDRQRRYRRRGRQAVSDIVATILLVAIGVVLAAVMYVLVVGLNHGPNSAPLGANFSWGNPVNVTPSGSSPEGCGASGTPNAFCYSVEIAGSAVSTSNFALSLRTSGGSTVAWPNGGTSPAGCTAGSGCQATPTVSQIVLLSPTAAAPVATYSTTTAGWTAASGYAGSVSGGYTVVIYLVGTSAVNAGLSGDQLVAVGSSGYSGIVTSNAFS
jgi:hypothetical protein